VTATYRIQVSWSDEDNAWIADVPELSYCTAHGPTPHEAVVEIEQAIESWLDAARAAGRPIPAATKHVANA
jgi:predicted RNase H-like HicB family nuclease